MNEKIIKTHGSIHRIRKMSGFSFLILRTAHRLIQCVLEPEKCEIFSPDGRPWKEALKEEMCIRMEALEVAEPRSRTGWELHPVRIRILSVPAEAMPVVIHGKEIPASLETILDNRPLTLRNERERAVFRIQDALVRGFTEFLQQQDFVQVHTPKLVSQGAEGGANIFRLDYFGKEAYLAQSPQFYKQMMVGVYERVFEIGPVFRAEKHDTARHLNEYTSVDLEMGYIEGFEELCRMEEAMIRHALEGLKAICKEELDLLQVRIPRVEAIPFIRFHEAKEQVAKRYHRPIREKDDLDPEEEKLLCRLIGEETGSEFVFVTHYPTAKRPFYAMEDEKEPQVTKSFDLLFRGLEVTTGGQRIHTYADQLAKMKARGMDPAHFESYLMIHKAGMPPHGGLGMGLERFTARLLELDNVRRACLFPRDIHRLIP
ncbi:MAG TPA: aspartate--tRNA(Asn) ligase [Candidatus Eisenbergiella merdipullorum]|uniref:Aspartate--tRNA ligase n=1 Tax=Candidatus Eisenbergiella merdipullorum TaxID=2838553 RepID=A0A9D2I8M0_9FIRM|nr:aspartate--tRNA(Asn) ligase [Candidatus Eisenbergiella merdipullorum]